LLERASREPGKLQEFYDHVSREGLDVRLPPIEEMREVLKDPGAHFRIQGAEKPSLGFSMVTIKEVAQQLLSMNWCRCFAPQEESFVTSDTPLNIFHQEGALASFGGGLALSDVEVSFPISPRICLCFDRRSRQSRRNVGIAFVRRINRRIAFGAERIVIANVRSRRLEQLVRDASRSGKGPKFDRRAIRRWFDQRLALR
jgi:hypothetical protein